MKLSESGNTLSGGNLKDIRFYVGSTQFTASAIVPHFGADFYIDRVIGTVRPATWFNMVVQQYGNGYPIPNGDGTYYSHEGYIKGSILPGGPIRPGTTWLDMTRWIRLPSTSTAQDGALKVWIGGQLALDITNFKMKDTGSLPYFTSFKFYPSSEATEPFEHWMDEMVIYEGYVSPDGSAPQPVDGSCGPAHSETFDTLSSDNANLCSEGDVGNFVTGETQHTWDCLGQYNGTNESCLAFKSEGTVDENGLCGASDGGSFSELSQDDPSLCLKGVVSNFTTDDDAWLWMCDGTGTGTDDPCNADKILFEGGGIIRASGSFNLY
jgi:hypothetical protein